MKPCRTSISASCARCVASSSCNTPSELLRLYSWVFHLFISQSSSGSSEGRSPLKEGAVGIHAHLECIAIPPDLHRLCLLQMRQGLSPAITQCGLANKHFSRAVHQVFLSADVSMDTFAPDPFAALRTQSCMRRMVLPPRKCMGASWQKLMTGSKSVL